MDFNALKETLQSPYVIDKAPQKKHYVAYIDILGYKKFFDAHPDKVEILLDAMSNGYQNIVHGINIMNSFFFVDKKIELRCFSDNLVVFCEVPDKSGFKQTLMLLVEAVKQIQRILLFDYGLFVRGAIVKGQFAANEMFVFGRALIDAVKSEENDAVNPRIIVSQPVVNDMQADWLYDDPATQSVYNDFVKVFSLFESSSNYELANKCYTAYRLFDDIVSEIPFVVPVEDIKRLDKTRNYFNDMMHIIKNNRNNTSILEQVYKKLLGEKTDMLDIFNSVAQRRNYQIVDYINTMAASSFYKDQDDWFIVDYLNMPDFTHIFKPEVLKLLLGSFFKAFSDFPEIVEEATGILDAAKLNDVRSNILSLHRKAVLHTLKNDAENYKQYTLGNIENYDERVIKKHLWSMQYHNWHCKRFGFDDMKIDCTLSIGKNSFLFIENIIDTNETP